MKGILFKPDMIKAIVEGRKTVTRRLFNPQPSDEETIEYGNFTPGLIDKNGELYPASYEVFGAYTADGEYSWKPRYHFGETVYVKEAWWEDSGDIYFKSDIPEGELTTNMHFTEPIGKAKWKSPMFLPEKFARYFLKIVSVKPERLQAITEADAVREGVGALSLIQDARMMYQRLWDDINGEKISWSSNPWVWRIEFNQAAGSKAGLKR